MDKITRSYVVLLSIFGLALVVGSVKGIVSPDETVYVPGRAVIVYDPDTKDPWETTVHSSAFKFDIAPKQIQTSLFQGALREALPEDEKPKNYITTCK